MGNAVYIFRIKSMPFELKGSIKGTGKNEWRQLRGVHYLIHKDDFNGYAKWEHYFENYLTENIAVLPSNVQTLKPKTSKTYAKLSKEKMDGTEDLFVPKTASVNHTPPSDVDEIRKFCVRYGMKFEVEKPKNRLIVRTGNSNMLISNYLDAQGFKYILGEACWVRSY
jgi:hypothetical protein